MSVAIAKQSDFTVVLGATTELSSTQLLVQVHYRPRPASAALLRHKANYTFSYLSLTPQGLQLTQVPKELELAIQAQFDTSFLYGKTLFTVTTLTH